MNTFLLGFMFGFVAFPFVVAAVMTLHERRCRRLARRGLAGGEVERAALAKELEEVLNA